MRIAQQAGHGIEYAQLTGGTPTQRAPDSYCAWRVCHVNVNLTRPACCGATAYGPAEQQQRARNAALHVANCSVSVSLISPALLRHGLRYACLGPPPMLVRPCRARHSAL